MLRRKSPLIGLLLVAITMIIFQPSMSDAATSSDLRPSQFKGVNWADPRDNFVDGPVIPSGLSTSDDYRATYGRTEQILAGFRTNLGANTVRLPVNPYSVGTTWWRSYRAVVDAAVANGFKVVLSYWEGTGANKDGYVDDLAAWWSMWDTLVKTYSRTPGVYFEPMNEPHGYTAADWEALVASWLQRYNGLPRNRVFVSGTGYNDNVTTVCSDPALDGTYLSLHNYGFWATRDYQGWRDSFLNAIGDCAGRTVIDEFGSPMTTGLNYDDATSTDNYVAYLRAGTDVMRELQLGGIYWPGLRTDDSYSLQTLAQKGSRLVLTTTNASGVDRLEWGWGRSTASH